MFLDDPQEQSSVDLQSYPYGDRRLNTAEAQSYVCAIQVQFHDQPDVYSQFLGLLKEFKLEHINATGLVKAVLQLFNGRLPLMQDFNTFLPVGYRINYSPDDSSNIIVTTPTGTMLHTTDSSADRSSTPESTIDTPSDSSNSWSSHSQSPVDPQGHSSIDHRLNISDALNYLDAVKIQFHDQLDVYNQFLDIMKGFKNKLIDTLGVIKRISELFNGHSALIQGFNTFLPVGYRIECSTDANDLSYITVTTPTGTMMQTTNNGPGRGPILWSMGPVPGSAVPPGSEPSVRLPSPEASGTDDDRSIESTVQYIQKINCDPETYRQVLDILSMGGVPGSAIPPAPESNVRPPSPGTSSAYDRAIEPAVRYVQKVKDRCDRETYGQFLDILSRYYHKPGTMDEEEVAQQIVRLFKDAPDLRADFRIFLPEQGQQVLEESLPRVSPPAPESNVRPPSREATNHAIEPATQYTGVESRFDPEAYSQLQDTLNLYRQQPGMFDEKDLLQQIACLVDGLFVKIK